MNGNTTYYFHIYPYTNGGTLTDYKNDGAPPIVNETTEDVFIILSEGFENGWGDWERVSLVGNEVWEIGDLYPEYGLIMVITAA